MDTQSSNENIYDKVYAEKKDLVFLTALKYVNYDEYIAEDIMQEVFMNLYKHTDKLNEEYLTGWLLMSARNAALSYQRKHKREILDENIEQMMDFHKSYKSAENEWFEADRICKYWNLNNKILEALYSVNPRWFNLFVLVFCLGKSQRDVADEMGISIGALRSILHRARKWIDKNFTDEKDDI